MVDKETKRGFLAGLFGGYVAHKLQPNYASNIKNSRTVEVYRNGRQFTTLNPHLSPGAVITNTSTSGNEVYINTSDGKLHCWSMKPLFMKYSRG